MNTGRAMIPINVYLECKLHFLKKEKERLIEEMSSLSCDGRSCPEAEVKADMVVFIENQIIQIEREKAENIQNSINSNRDKSRGSSIAY